MDKVFQKFLRSGIDLSPVGVERREDNNPYFCTPKGASIFGWAGVDGIHFCFVRDFGGMVFSVSPMNSAPDFVHPLANDFEDFLRLLLACSDSAALEQAWMWGKAQFEAFLQDNPPTQDQQRTLSELAEKMKLTPMEQPWVYIKKLQASFDYSKIKYTEDYYDVDMNPEAEPTMPEWKVYFEGNFWGHSGKDHAGTEIRLNKQFDWARHHWVIPAAYSCSKGLVMDFCMRTPEEDIRKFITKWDLHPENDSCEYFTQEQQMQIDLDNPLCLDFIPRLELNGKTMLTSHGCSVVFNPCLPDGVINEAEAKWALEHYDLDTSYGWMIFRAAFPWTSKRRPEIKALSLTMEQQSCRVPGPHFKAHAPGDSFSFLHPVSGKKYTLTVQELEQQTISEKRYGSDRWFYPTHFTAMSYTLSPEPDSDVTICDCAEGDKPLKIAPCSDRYAPEARNDIPCIGIITEYGLPAIGFCSICYAMASLIGYFIEDKSVPKIVDGIFYILVVLSLPVSFWGVSIYGLYKSRLEKQHKHKFDRLFYISAISEMPDNYNIDRYHLSCYDFIDNEGMFDIERWRAYELSRYDQGISRILIDRHHHRLIPTDFNKSNSEP